MVLGASLNLSEPQYPWLWNGDDILSTSQASIKLVTKYQAHWSCSGRACVLTRCLLGNSRLCLFPILCISLRFSLSLPSDFLLCNWTGRPTPSLGSDHELLSFLLRAHLLLLAPVFYQSRRRDRREISCPMLRGWEEMLTAESLFSLSLNI